MEDLVERYLKDIEVLRQQSEATPELSLREPLLRLVRDLGASLGRRDLVVAPEASAGFVGQPDIFVKDGPQLVGFLETKAPGVDLMRQLKSSVQLKRYSRSLPNWILTDYHQFVFIRNGETE